MASWFILPRLNIKVTTNLMKSNSSRKNQKKFKRLFTALLKVIIIKLSRMLFKIGCVLISFDLFYQLAFLWEFKVEQYSKNKPG